jgi:phospholipid transport system substrate-binding protein
MKRTFLACLFIFFVAAMPATHAGELEDGATAFIKKLEQEALGSLTDPDKPRQDRIEKFRTLFEEKFAVAAIGRWTLGRNWRAASESDQQEFLKLFEDLMVATYVDRFENYAGEKVEILKTVPVDENRATVHTEIKRPNAPDSQPISVLWRVGRQGDIYKVLDVVVEGASMSVTLQREFASIVKNTGSVAGLLEELRKKTSTLAPSKS